MKRCLFSVTILFLFLSFGCGQNSSRVNSSSFKTKEERARALQKYFHPRSEVIDAEFDIYDVNMNDGSIPGATDRNFKVAVFVKKEFLDKWMDSELVRTSYPKNFDWGKALVRKNPAFLINSSPEIYASEEKQMFLFRKTGVIFIRVVQN